MFLAKIKSGIFVFLLLALILFNIDCKAQGLTWVPDDNFENYLEANGMGDGIALNDSVSTSNINTVTNLVVSSLSISDLTGIEGFTSLINLDAQNNSSLTSVDLSQNIALADARFNSCQLNSLDVSNNPTLSLLTCGANNLSSLDLSQNPLLTTLDCWNNSITVLDLSQNFFLTSINCNNNQISSLDFSNNLSLVNISCNSNQISSLDLVNNTALQVLWCPGNQITALDLSQNSSLNTIRCENNQLSFLDIKNGNNVNVTQFFSTGNPALTCINVDDSTYSSNNWLDIDLQQFFGEICYCSLSIDSQGNVSCYAGYDGFLQLSGSGGAEEFFYSIQYFNSIYNIFFELAHAPDTGDFSSTPILFTNVPANCYLVTMQDSLGCIDSANICITSPDSIYSITNITACENFAWNYNIYSLSGTYNSVLSASNGCDSSAILNLVINYSDTSYTNVSSCNDFVWNGITYSSSGTYYSSLNQFTNTSGCDSIVCLNLTINALDSSNISVVACNSYFWNGVTYSTGGIYINTFTNLNGCDSIVTLDLSINYFCIGCTDSLANNYNPFSTIDDSTCLYSSFTFGCTDTSALNYDLLATVDDSSCCYNSSNTLNQCIVAEYPFTGNANDASGNGNNANVFGAALTADRFGNTNSAYVFDGTNYIEAADLYSQSFTINIWVKTTNDGIYFCKHYDASLSNSSYMMYSHVSASCQPRTYYTNQTSSVTDVLATSTVCDNTWHMITATLDSNDLKIYVDGVFENQSIGGIAQLTSFPTLIGARYNNGGTVVPDFIGAIDDIKYFNCALSSQQVDSMWNIESSFSTPCNNLGCLDPLALNFDPNATVSDSTCVYANYGCLDPLALNYNSLVNIDDGSCNYCTNNTTYVSLTACDSIIWNGTTYNQTGSYTYSYSPNVGTFINGGYIFYIDSISNIAYIADSNFIGLSEWGCYGTAIVGADSASIGYGYQNTLDIINSSCITSSDAAMLCYNYSNSYSDWYLPSLNELELIRQNLFVPGYVNYNSGDVNNWFWSSTECANNPTGGATNVNFSGSSIGPVYCNNKNSLNGGVIPIREYQICDSTIILNLTINHADTSYTNITECDSVLWNGEWYDSSGTYYHNFNNPNSYSLNFDGVDDYVTLNQTPTFAPTTSTDFTISIWVNPNTVHEGAIASQYENVIPSNCNFILALMMNNTFRVSGNGYGYYEFGTANIGVWQYVSLVFHSSGTVDTYLDGVFTGSSVLSLSSTVGTMPLEIGDLFTGGCSGCVGPFDGLLDNVDIWNAALTPQDIQDNMLCSPIGNESELIGFWNFEEGLDSTVYDQTSNGNNGTISGSTYDIDVPIQSCQLTNVNGCDSTAVLNLTINNSSTNTVFVTACDSFDWDGVAYDSTGLYTNIYSRLNGCDSSVVLDLTINNGSSSIVTITACDSYFWNGVTYTTTGLYDTLFTNTQGCDSIASLDLTINYSSSSSFSITYCDSFDWDGVTYDSTGLYTNIYSRLNGCDSSVVLDLTILNSTNSLETTIACDSYFWNGVTYTTTGFYDTLFTNTQGCDSTAYLDLTIANPTLSLETRIACSFYLWNGMTYTTTGIYNFLFTNSQGCDSIAMLDLLINNTYTNTDSFSVCIGDSIYVGNNIYYNPGNYIDSLQTLNGCDSIIATTLFYLQAGCTDSSALNYDSLAICDDGSCIASIYGCLDTSAVNYYSGANFDDGSCIYLGCIDSNAYNYNPIASIDDGSCVYAYCSDPVPTGLFVNDITDTKTRINWNNMNDSACMVWKYFVRYREVGTFSWITKSAGVGSGLCNIGLNINSKILQNLSPSTTYEYKMKVFYCGGTVSSYSPPVQFTTKGLCPEITNLTAQTFYFNPNKVRFNWDTTGLYVFARIVLRVDSIGSSWQTAGGYGIYYPNLSANKYGMQPGEFYRAQARTFCDTNITSYRSWWTPPIFWQQPSQSRINGGKTISNLDIYPNPSRDIFDIIFVSDKKQNLKLRILNIVGGEVYKEERQEFIGEYTKQISLDNFGKGVYFLEIETNNGVINKKLILQ